MINVNQILLSQYQILNFKDKQFDLVLMLEVLEHVEKPFDVSSEILRVLQPEGNLLLSVPFTFGIHEAPYDFWRFTKYGLMKLLMDLMN